MSGRDIGAGDSRYFLGRVAYEMAITQKEEGEEYKYSMNSFYFHGKYRSFGFYLYVMVILLKKCQK